MKYDASREALYRPWLKPVFVGVDGIPPFEFGNSGLSCVNGWWLSNASHLAYYDFSRLEHELQRAGLRLVRCFDGSSTQAYLAASDDFVILAFRGTESSDLADLKVDADIRLVPFRNEARVHRGFLVALDEVWAEIDEELERLASLGLPTWYTGHSLGAALATLAAARRRPGALYTFGSPRIGDEEFVRFLDGVPVQRVVNCSDVVATLPGRFLGYRHGGELIFFASGGGLHVNPSWLQVFFSRALGSARYSATLPWFRRGVVTARSFADHAIVNYTAALAGAVGSR